jgi:hypothetical protein
MSPDPFELFHHPWSSHAPPQLHQAQTLPLVPSSPSFRSKLKQIKTDDPADLSKIATQFQASSVSPGSTPFIESPQ